MRYNHTIVYSIISRFVLLLVLSLSYVAKNNTGMSDLPIFLAQTTKLRNFDVLRNCLIILVLKQKLGKYDNRILYQINTLRTCCEKWRLPEVHWLQARSEYLTLQEKLHKFETIIKMKRIK